jgi:DNA-binding transcriptional MerR regulator
VSRQRSIEAIRAAEFVTIGELVRLTGARYSTLKYYTEEGMLPFEQAEENLTRRYRRVESLERIALIKRLKSNGLTIAHIKESLPPSRKAGML